METLDALSETLDMELKGWLNLDEPREAALFAKACLAMRNNDGGRLVLGINDVTTKSIPTPAGLDPYQAYHVDNFEREFRQNAVYIRTISNGRPSFCEPVTAADWDKLMRICFDNREADVGRFMRRHLGEMLAQMGIDVQTMSKEPNLNPEQAALDFLQQGWERLDSRWTEKFESPKA